MKYINKFGLLLFLFASFTLVISEVGQRDVSPWGQVFMAVVWFVGIALFLWEDEAEAGK